MTQGVELPDRDGRWEELEFTAVVYGDEVVICIDRARWRGPEDFAPFVQLADPGEVAHDRPSGSSGRGRGPWDD